MNMLSLLIDVDISINTFMVQCRQQRQQNDWNKIITGFIRKHKSDVGEKGGGVFLFDALVQIQASNKNFKPD